MIDLETGGLNPKTDGIVQIAAMPFDITNGVLTELDDTYIPLELLVVPQHDKYYHKEAMEIHGITFEKMKEEGVPPRLANSILHKYIRDTLGYLYKPEYSGLIWAHEATFDHAFLHQLESDVQETDCIFPERCNWSCTKFKFRNLVSVGIVSNKDPHNNSVLKYYSISEDNKHDALNDVYAQIKGLKCILEDEMRYYKTSIINNRYTF